MTTSPGPYVRVTLFRFAETSVVGAVRTALTCTQRADEPARSIVLPDTVSQSSGPVGPRHAALARPACVAAVRTWKRTAVPAGVSASQAKARRAYIPVSKAGETKLPTVENRTRAAALASAPTAAVGSLAA